MHITFSLSNAQYAAADRSGVMVGLPISVLLDGGIMSMGGTGATPDFVQSIPAGHPSVRSFGLERTSFCGRVVELERWDYPEVEEVVGQLLVDCGVPLRFDLLQWESGADDASFPYGLAKGDWLTGVAFLQGRLALSPGDLLWDPVRGSIVDIQRLNLDPTNPTFGTLHWLHSLPKRSFAPDQVFVTIEV